MKMIKAIVFDLDGVYFPESGKKGFHKRLVRLVGDEDKVEHALYKSDEMRAFVTSKITPEELVRWFNGYLGTDFTVESLGEFWTKDYKIDSEVQEYIKQTRKKGILACTVSNNNKIRVDALQKKFNFLDDFDVKIFSYEVGTFKPNKEIFKALIEQTKVKPQEIIYSDDNPDRIRGAQELGINTFIYKSFMQFVQKLSEFF